MDSGIIRLMVLNLASPAYSGYFKKCRLVVQSAYWFNFPADKTLNLQADLTVPGWHSSLAASPASFWPVSRPLPVASVAAAVWSSPGWPCPSCRRRPRRSRVGRRHRRRHRVPRPAWCSRRPPPVQGMRWIFNFMIISVKTIMQLKDVLSIQYSMFHLLWVLGWFGMNFH